jgi:hypothetical protein
VDRLRPAARRGQRGGRVHLLHLKLLLALLLAAAWPAGAQDNPESAYLSLHRATLAHNLNEMMLYASEEKRAELLDYAGDPIKLKLISSMMPRVYTVRSLATSQDTSRARMRATGNFTFMGTTAPTYGVVDLVRESGAWKVAKFEWTGDKPHGWDAAVAQSPVRRSASGVLEKVPPPPPVAAPKPPPEAIIPLAGEPPRPSPVVSPQAGAPSETPSATSAAARVVESRNRGPCEIKPVMSDDDLLNCGASPR